MTINIVVDITSKPGTIDTIREALEEFVQRTAEEAGNLRFEVYLDATDSDKLVLWERWVDEAAHHAHTELAHTKVFRQLIGDLLQSPPRARRVEPIAGRHRV